MKTLRELLLNNKSYIVELKINKLHSLFIEGLNEYGETINKPFNINYVKSVLVEVIDNNTGDVIDNYYTNSPYKLNDHINDIISDITSKH